MTVVQMFIKNQNASPQLLCRGFNVWTFCSNKSFLRPCMITTSSAHPPRPKDIFFKCLVFFSFRTASSFMSQCIRAWLLQLPPALKPGAGNSIIKEPSKICDQVSNASFLKAGFKAWILEEGTYVFSIIIYLLVQWLDEWQVTCVCLGGLLL